MIIQCDKCLTKFKLDEAKITGKGINVRCTKCQNVFTVTAPEAVAPPPKVVAPPPPPPADEGFEFNPDAFAGTGKQEAPGQGDFGGFELPPQSEQDKGETEPSFSGGQAFDFGAPPEAGQGAANDWSLGGGGGGFGNDAFGSEAGAGEPPAFGGDDMAAGAPPQESEEPLAQQPPSPPAEEDWGIEGAVEGQAETAAPDVAAEGAPGKDEQPGAKKSAPLPSRGAAREVSDTDFAAALSKSIKAESAAVAPAGAAVKKEGAASSKKTGIAVAIIIILIVTAIGAAYYFSQGGGSQTGVGKNVEIDSIKGYFVENQSVGRFFVIEALIKNTTASPQPVSGVTGVIYDGKGAKLSTKPAAVMSTADIANITKEDIGRIFRPDSLGTIPPKGALPIVVIFAVTPAGMSEYGVEIAPN